MRHALRIWASAAFRALGSPVAYDVIAEAPADMTPVEQVAEQNRAVQGTANARLGPPPPLKPSRPPHPRGLAAGGAWVESGTWTARRSELVRRAIAEVLDVGRVADLAVDLSEPAEREVMERERHC
jgi:hypothetical protein